MRIQWDYQHTLVLVATTVVATTAGYIVQQDATTLLAAFESWAALKVMLAHVGLIDLIALGALLKQSPLVPGGRGGQPSAGKAEDTIPAPPPKPPVVTRAVTNGEGESYSIHRRASVLFSVLLVACAGAIPIVVPALDLAACVAEHALAGEGIAEIARDCKQDIPAIVNVLLESKDPKVRQSAAYGEAMRVRSIFVRDP